MSTTPQFQQQPYPQPKPPKKRHTFRNVAIVVGGLLALLIVAAVLSPGQPAKEATAPAAVKTAAPVVTPTDKPSAAATTATVKPSPKVTHKPAPSMTASQEQAVGTAEDYLQGQSFSRKGLIEQLEFEGFSAKDATFGVDHLKVDWSSQAAGVAKNCLSTQHFSRAGLIEQLEYEGFTHKQAVYGVTKAGL